MENCSGEVSTVIAILGGEFPLEDEEKMMDAIETVYAIESVYGGEKAIEVLADLAALPHLVDALSRVMCKYGKHHVHSETSRLIKTMRLLRDVCKVEPSNVHAVGDKCANMTALLHLLRPAPPASSPFDDNSAVEIRSLSAELLALCAIRPDQPAASRNVQTVIKSVRATWWYGKPDKDQIHGAQV